MRALVCHDPQGIDALRLETVPSPVLTPGSIRVRVSFGSINPPDYLMAQGKYQVRPETPFVVGIEGAGTVVEVAPDVTAFSPGQRVMIYPGHGCLAEEIVMPAARAHAEFDHSNALTWVFLVGFPLSLVGMVMLYLRMESPSSNRER